MPAKTIPAFKACLRQLIGALRSAGWSADWIDADSRIQRYRQAIRNSRVDRPFGPPAPLSRLSRSLAQDVEEVLRRGGAPSTRSLAFALAGASGKWRGRTPKSLQNYILPELARISPHYHKESKRWRLVSRDTI